MAHIANISFGKDSTAMVLRLIEEEKPLDEVRFFDTGMEFEAIYNVRDAVVPIIERAGVEYIEVKPDHPFWWDMFCRPVHERGGGMHYGYGWCGGPCRWGTTSKQKKLGKPSDILYVGIAADETERVRNEPNKRYPLAEWGMTEADCLAYCYERGIEWDEGGGSLV